MAGSFGNERTTGGISGAGSKNVTPIYKMQGGTMGPAKIQGPQAPKKKNPSTLDKIIEGIKKELTRPTQRVRSTDLG
jgi:hypothetical protein